MERNGDDMSSNPEVNRRRWWVVASHRSDRRITKDQSMLMKTVEMSSPGKTNEYEKKTETHKRIPNLSTSYYQTSLSYILNPVVGFYSTKSGVPPTRPGFDSYPTPILFQRLLPASFFPPLSSSTLHPSSPSASIRTAHCILLLHRLPYEQLGHFPQLCFTGFQQRFPTTETNINQAWAENGAEMAGSRSDLEQEQRMSERSSDRETKSEMKRT
ncbi:hypothetical protein LXL04_030667 [Taraxacum kok-saghyz]